MSLICKLAENGRNKERKKLAQELLGAGVKVEKIKEITGLSQEKVKQLMIDKSKLM